MEGNTVTKWEYWVDRVSMDGYDELPNIGKPGHNPQGTGKLDYLGAQGWELIAVNDREYGPPYCIFKRPIEE